MTDLKSKKESLKQEYLKFLEEAYNLRQSDSALSDFSEYRALQLLHEINRLNFLEYDFKACLN